MKIPHILFVLLSSVIYTGCYNYSSKVIKFRYPIVIYDNKGEDHMPSKFRNIIDLEKYESVSDDVKKPNFKGVENYNNVIASAQFTKDQLLNIQKKYSEKKITVVDMRGETHFFINGLPYVVYNSEFNEINKDKKLDVILNDEKAFVSQLQNILKKRNIIAYKAQKLPSLIPGKKAHLPVEEILIKSGSSVELESDIAISLGMKYVRIPVTDHDVASKDITSAIINLVKNSNKNDLFYVHCRGGAGRTSTFILVYDIYKNAKNVSFEDILYRNYWFSGHDITSKNKDRQDVLLKFYNSMRNHK